MILPWLISIFIFCLDQLSKLCISHALLVGEPSLPVFKDVFHISLVHNTGVAFGLFKNHNTVLAVFSLAVIFYIGRQCVLPKRKKSAARRIALGLILGGACGNLLDRVRLGYIVDFLDFRIWPVFNIADSALTIGILLLAFELFSSRKRTTP